MEKKEQSRKLIKNTFIVGLGTISSKAIIFLMAPLFSRWLSVEAYGEFDLISTYVSLLIPFCTLSISEAVFRFLLDDAEEENKDRILSSSLFVILIGYVICIALFYIVSFFVKPISFSAEMVLLLISQILYSYASEITRGEKKLSIYSLFSLISVVLLSTLSTVFLLVLKMGLSGIVLGYSIGYLLSAFGMLAVSRAFSSFSIKNVDRKIMGRMLGYSWPLIPNSISWWIVGVSDRVVINTVIGLAANGIYAVANKVPSIVSILASVFHVSWLQSSSENVSEENYSEYCSSVYNDLFSFVVSASSVLVCSNFLWYTVFFDIKYYDAFYYTPILIVAIVFSTLAQFFGGIMVSKKETKLNGLTNLVAAGTNLIVNIMLIKWIGLYAAAISTLVAYVVMFVLRKIIIKKYVEIHVSKKNIYLFCAFILLFISVYLNHIVLNSLMLVLSLGLFFISNKKLIVGIFNGVIKKKETA